MPEFPFVLRYRRTAGGSQYDYDTLDIGAESPFELEQRLNEARGVQELASFFGQSDTQTAANKVAQQMGPTETVSDTPNCKTCGGATKKKTVNTKNGPRTAFECLQQKGDCKSGQWPTTTWPNEVQKGRDA